MKRSQNHVDHMVWAAAIAVAYCVLFNLGVSVTILFVTFLVGLPLARAIYAKRAVRHSQANTGEFAVPAEGALVNIDEDHKRTGDVQKEIIASVTVFMLSWKMFWTAMAWWNDVNYDPLFIVWTWLTTRPFLANGMQRVQQMQQYVLTAFEHLLMAS